MVKDRLGFTTNKVGTHSNRLAAAMAMYLARVPVYTIMLISQWLSDAFLVYIRKQVQDFTKGISSKMLISPTTLQSQTLSQATTIPGQEAI
eukprot:11590171-Ditylum_brightwellii.AAC.1